MSYQDFILSKAVAQINAGFEPTTMNEALFGYQANSVAFALMQGRAALFMDTGLGKTLCELEWAQQVVEKTNAPVIILAPLAVAAQHKREADKFGYDAKVVRSGDEVIRGINITNYDRLHQFDTSVFSGVVLDESSILKNSTGKTRTEIIRQFAGVPYRLAATATPSPNDHTELGNHSEFLGVLNHADMLPRWFINDTADTGEWRLKGHAVEPFWDWVASWARCLSKPSDLGFSDAGFDLPPLNLIKHEVEFHREATGYDLFHVPDLSATGIHQEKRATINERAGKIAELAKDSNETWVVWCETDYESKALMAAIGKDAVELKGADSIERKEAILESFSDGGIRVLVTKPSIAGFGMNWQHCNHTAFVGVSYSYEQFYQSIRRFWRFGQKKPVNAHVAMTSVEDAIWAVVMDKSTAHDDLKKEMRAAMKRNIGRKTEARLKYSPSKIATLPGWITN